MKISISQRTQILALAKTKSDIANVISNFTPYSIYALQPENISKKEMIDELFDILADDKNNSRLLTCKCKTVDLIAKVLGK